MQSVAAGAMHDPAQAVIEDINWTVTAGEYWVVAGLQGSGKSDFLLMTGGLMPPAAGAYRLLGEPMPIFDEARLAHRLRLGLVFETGRLFNHLTVWENVALPLRYHRNLTRADAATEVQKMLAATGIEEWAESTPGALGRNWRTRVGLARALILRPEVLLADNPVAGLDLRHASWWLGFFEQLSKGHELLGGRPMTLVVTASDLRPWQGRACRFAMVRDRRFRLLGSWDQLQAENAELVRELVMTEMSEG